MLEECYPLALRVDRRMSTRKTRVGVHNVGSSVIAVDIAGLCHLARFLRRRRALSLRAGSIQSASSAVKVICVASNSYVASASNVNLSPLRKSEWQMVESQQPRPCHA
jgi:hypothetical protein